MFQADSRYLEGQDLINNGYPGDWALRIEGFWLLMCLIFKKYFLHNLQLAANTYFN